MDVSYLATDLEIESEHDLSKIIEEFGDNLRLLHRGEDRGYKQAYFSASEDTQQADEAINYYCSLIDRLSEEARKIWDGCCSRILDVGFESGVLPQTHMSEIKATTIQRIVEIGASIRITVYPVPTSLKQINGEGVTPDLL